MQTSPIGILCGTFDPIHLGHMHLANKMFQLCGLQKILFIPCNQSPLRSPPIASSLDRFNMVKLAISDSKYFLADDREIKKTTISYTVTSLESLCKENENTPLGLIMALDVFNRFDEWYQWQRILKLTHLLIANRPGSQITNQKSSELLRQYQVSNAEQLQKKKAGLIYLADINPLAIASTEIRALIKEKKDISHLVVPSVQKYIYENGLYIN